MHLSSSIRKAAFIAGITAVGVMCFALPVDAAQSHASRRSACQTNKPEPKSLAFVVRYVDRRPSGEFVLTFDNGEIWQQTDRSKSVTIERGEQVVIRRATTGKFTLWSRSGQSTLVERVH